MPPCGRDIAANIAATGNVVSVVAGLPWPVTGSPEVRMARISRARRAELQRRAQEVRGSGQRARWRVERIAATIQAELPELLPLEAWRLAFGWSRRQVVEGVQALYLGDGLVAPALNTSMLCRWEHGQVQSPDVEYCVMLCRLYQADPVQLGLAPAAVLLPTRVWGPRYRPWQGAIATNGHSMTADNLAAQLAAVRESIQLAVEVEGASGGAQTIDQLEAAVAYYSANYSRFLPDLLATEVHLSRALVGGMLRQAQTEDARRELRRLAGWMSALVGALAFHLADYQAAQIHLSTAARMGTAVGENHLICWSLGAQAMTANEQHRFLEALDLAGQALEYADTPLRRAQILAWGQLRPLAGLGDARRSEALAVMAEAQDQMSADPIGEQSGRFGFDHPELHLHLAEVSLQLGDHTAARTHALASQAAKTIGGPGWAAATLALARAEAARGHRSDAAALAVAVLDAIPAPAIRETSRARLRDLDQDLFIVPDPGSEARGLRERIRELPALAPVGRISDEPNGQ
jgi:tetratricopeptide (TPR) repeat protein